MPPVVKPWWVSKTVWMNLIVAIAAFVPPVQDWIGKNPEQFAWVFTAINVVLRLISKGKITLQD